MTVALAMTGAIGDVSRFHAPQKLVSYLGLNPSVRQSGPDPAYHGRITKQGRGYARGMLVEAAWAAAQRMPRRSPEWKVTASAASLTTKDPLTAATRERLGTSPHPIPIGSIPEGSTSQGLAKYGEWCHTHTSQAAKNVCCRLRGAKRGCFCVR